MIKTYVNGIYTTPPCLMIWRNYDTYRTRYVIAYTHVKGSPEIGFQSDYIFDTQKESKDFLKKNFPDSELWIESTKDYVRFQEGTL